MILNGERKVRIISLSRKFVLKLGWVSITTPTLQPTLQLRMKICSPLEKADDIYERAITVKFMANSWILNLILSASSFLFAPMYLKELQVPAGPC